VVVAFALGSREAADAPPPDAAPSPTEETTPQPVVVAAVRDFDPDDEGGGENPDQTGLATDGDPSTAWETKTYFDGPVLAPYRSGVGLALDLGEVSEVSEVQVALTGGPYDLQLLAGPEDAGAPTAVDGLATLVTRSGVSNQVTLTADEPVRTRYLVVWLTALPRPTAASRAGSPR
jgi:hypothetical protein